MGETGPDDDLVQEYVAESSEHLATIEADLLAIEQGGAAIDEQLVNRVFRAAHSIKGGAGFFDLVKIRELAHKTESALDLVRSRQMVPTPEVVSVLLLAFDRLREMIRDHRQSNQVDIADYLDALARLTADHLPADQKHCVRGHVEVPVEGGRRIRIAAFDLNQARRGGKSIYLIEYDLIHDIQRRGQTPLAVFKGLIECGTILETNFDLDSAGTLDDEPSNRLVLEVLYATVLEPDLIGQVVEVPPERVLLVEKNGAVRPLGAAPSAEPAPVAAPLPAPVAAPPPAPMSPAATEPAETTIRLSVTLLDSLMTLAGELVLSRNQLNESVARNNQRGIRSGAQRLNLVTSELQEVVTLTRMQPVGSLFARFPRLVRDLARTLGKEVQLQLEGAGVEVDKTILEGLSDPLTHMVRNAVDHGIETPAERLAAGKPAAGTVTLTATHQAGQVLVEISDDGKGLALDKLAASSVAKGMLTDKQAQAMSDRDKMSLIFLPGVSTAGKLSDVSGRGVGMDVVKTNLDKLGGKIEVDSAPGRGSRFRIKLPLTLAIIPSLLVSQGEDRFAIPQANVAELIRIPAGQIGQRSDRVGDAQVLILRDQLVPLVHLADVLGMPRQAGGAMNIVIADAGRLHYGLVVEELHDTVEIVVKPLGRHVKGLPYYAGATILGDGRVAVILDVAGLSAGAALSAAAAEQVSQTPPEEAAPAMDTQALLLFHNAPDETCAVPVGQISRIEHVSSTEVRNLGGRRTMHYRGAILPLVTLHDTASVGELSSGQRWVVIVFEHMGRPLGLLAAEPLDMLEAALGIDTVTLRQPGVAGSAVFKERTILLLDIHELAGSVQPEQVLPRAPVAAALPKAPAAAPMATVLLAEDSEFFRGQIRRLMEAVGCRVLAAEDGQAAWELLDRHAAEVDVVTTDVEMPRMDGLALTRQIRADGRFTSLPVIALSSLAGEEEVARGLAAGVDEYQVKLNEDELLESIRKAVARRKKQPGPAGCEA